VSIPTLPIDCGHCGRKVGAEIVAAEGVAAGTLQNPTWKPAQAQTLWLRCPACGEGSVRTAARAGINTKVLPGKLPLEDVPNLPGDVEGAWGEARKAYSVGAYTASEIMCRKILMHLAVDKAGSAPGQTFVQYINDLQAKNYIMAGLQPVVDKVRDRGNKANHELPASTEQEALATLTITDHLLVGIYKLPAMP
jgi:Domain of unknown function (DUF4145)